MFECDKCGECCRRLKGVYTREEFYKLNYEMCNRLKK